MRDKLAAVDNSRPIFIITHFPLHYNGSRTITNASNIIDVLNNAATGGTPDDPSDDKKTVFLWGHNHSMSNPYDTHYDTVYPKGSSIQYDSSHSKQTQFLYAAAGAMCDTEKDVGSGKVEGKGLVATVNSNDLITLSYYKADGTTVTKNGSTYEETEPVAVERFMIDEADESGLSVEIGRKLQLNTTVMPEDAKDYTVTWSSSDTTVATVDASGKVTGVSEGQAEITATLDDSVGGNTHTASVDIQVVPRTTSTPYVLTNTLTPGKNYLIVSANSGAAYALMNDNGTLSKATVNIKGDTIYTDAEDVVFEAQGSGTTINDLHNGNRYLKASSGGLQLLTTAGTSRPWEYDGSNHRLTNYKSNSGTATHYYVYYENGNFASSTSTSSSHVVYLFEETEAPEPDVTYDVTFKVENGKWDDSTSADKTVQVTGPEGSLTLDESQIPAAGSKPNSGYQAGGWDVTPDASTPISGDVTYTYTYAEQEQTGEKAYVLTDELTPGKNYIISNANSGTAQVLKSNSTTPAEVTIDGDTIVTDDSSIVFKIGEKGGSANYIGNEDGYVNHTSDNYLDFVSTPPSGITWTYDGSYLTYKNGGSTYYLYYKPGTGYNRYRIKSQSPATTEQLVYLFEETDEGHNMVHHEATEATCTQNGNYEYWSCDHCGKFFEDENGETEIEEGSWIIPASHDWSKPTYEWADDNRTVTAEYHCTRRDCDAEVVETANTTSEVTRQATCTTAGETKYTATFEGPEFAEQEKTDDTKPAALGHDMAHHEAVEPNCTEAGNNEYWSCERCNKFFADSEGNNEIEEGSWIIPAKGHDWSKPTYTWSDDNRTVTAEYHCTEIGCDEEVTETVNTTSVVTDPTCTATGMTVYTAQFEDRTFATQTKEVEIPATGHSFGEWTEVTPSSCEDAGLEQRQCSACGLIEEKNLDPKGHAWETEATVDVEATCTTDGSKSIHCSNCEAVKDSQTIPALGHDYHDVEGSAEAATCTRDGKEADQKCSRCHDVIEGAVIPALGHKWDEGTVTTQPTCTAKGVRTFECERCHDTRTEDIDALGHNMTEHPAVAATCTAAGNSAYWSCDRCEKFFSDENGKNEIEENSWVIEATGHEWGEPVYTWSDDNTKATAARACTREGCEASETETVDSEPGTFEPTCTTAGMHMYAAHFVNAAFMPQTKVIDIEALGHNMDAHPAVAATCTAAGNSAYWSCDRCNKFFSDENGEHEVAENSWIIEATGHKWDRGTVTTEPTCTAKGVKTFECERCHDTRTEDVDALGHNMEAHPAVAATCTAAGNGEYYSCDRCEKFFSDENGEHEIAENSWVIEAKGHDYHDVEGSAVAATCTKAGKAADQKCSRCHDVIEGAAIEALGHNMTNHEAKDPTCTEDGNYEYWSCDRCNKFFAGEDGDREVEEGTWIIPAGHDWSKPTYSWADDNRTVTAEYHCMNRGCNEEVTETVNTNSETTEPTCTIAGKTVYTAEFEDRTFKTQTKEIEIPAKGHDWSKPTYDWSDDYRTVTGEYHCTEIGCDEEVTETVNTDSETTEPTCTEAGKITYTAEFEDRTFRTQTEEVPIPAKGHKWDKGTVTTQPTCTAKGVKTFECENCDATRTEDVDALGHNMDAHAAVAATCTAAGNSAYYSCDRCNKFFSDEDGKNEIAENSWIIEAKGHKWDKGTVTTQPTCTTKSVKTFECENCDATRTEDVDALGHNMDAHAAVAATCTAAGNSAYYSCDRCHKYFSDEEGEHEVTENSWVIEAKGHDYQTVEGSAVAATCTTDGKKADKECSRCHDVIEGATIDALGHNMDAHPAVAATCTAAGNSEYYSCDRCNKFFSDDSGEHEVAENSWIIEAKGHDYQTVEGSAVAATCTKAGKKADKECSRCHDVIEGATIDALGHNMDAHPAVAATCTAAGNSAYYSCDRCNKFFSDDSGEHEVAENSWIIEAKGHDYHDVEGSAEAATCTKDGKEADQECSRCHDVIEGATIEALGHNMTKHEAKAATCTAAGNSEYYSCDRCNKFFSDESGKNEIEENSWIIEAKGHDYQTVEGSAVAATCTKNGKKADQECSRCHDVIEGATIEALGHNMTKHEANAATCTAAGNSAYWSCDRCEKFFSDKNGENEIEENSWIIPATGHDYHDVEGSAVAATCTKAGKAADQKCSRCHDVIEGAAIEALGHNTTKHEAKSATCTAAGNSEYYSCERCSKFFSDKNGETEIEENSWIIEAKGHKWGEGIITKEPTTTATGIMKYACENCGATKEEVLPKKAVANKPLIVANAVAKGKTSLRLSWNNVYEASRYIIYMAPGKKGKLKMVATTNNSNLHWTKTKLKKNSVYRFKVVAQKQVNGTYQNIDTSLVGYAMTGGVQGKFTNPKSLKINRSTITLAKGKTFKVKCTVAKLKKSKKLATKYAPKLRYRTSDSKVATVSKSGKITAKGKGACTIYIQTINGIWKTCHVTVR